jgi:hypothetical protein
VKKFALSFIPLPIYGGMYLVTILFHGEGMKHESAVGINFHQVMAVYGQNCPLHLIRRKEEEIIFSPFTIIRNGKVTWRHFWRLKGENIIFLPPHKQGMGS